jgi:hypothetical protein
MAPPPAFPATQQFDGDTSLDVDPMDLSTQYSLESVFMASSGSFRPFCRLHLSANLPGPALGPMLLCSCGLQR